ncbi:membrane protein [Leptolyngbya sp. Heron Island J]|uniref:YgaP family membrane protein n=1 Tax=Leptolyngbya sp. Heron Island J TaxID=1385935 RepID=UPI0003B98811|nr:DUF2892 domain-containing protein [Leptolyngbya sp. Heron Island J]ESA34199.1 membrane protein [Leptolyngbya sp. Heron Island J]
MFNNVGTVDRLLRLLVAIGSLYFGLTVYAGSTLGMVLDIVGSVALLSGVFGSCALYGLLGINTRKTNQDSTT